MKKLPPINALYWAFILSATTMGETSGDLISKSLGLGYGGGTIALLGLFLLAVTVDLWVEKSDFTYWVVVVLASTSGTTLSDYVTRTMGLGYGWGSLLLVFALAVVFFIWFFLVPTTPVGAGFTKATRLLYWAAILISSTLGTAFGDFLSGFGNIGYWGATQILAFLLLALMLVARFSKMPRQLCYWLAIVLTHPIGATAGDCLTKPDALGLGNVWSSLIMVLVFGVVILAGKWSNSRRLRTA